MKRFIYFLLILPLAMMIASCSDDDKIPDVSVQAQVSNAVVDDNGDIYVVKGDVLKIDGIKLINNTDKDGALGVVNYYLDYVFIGNSFTDPYGLEIPTENLKAGNYMLTAEAPVYVVDYPVCIGAFSFKLIVVESADELPGTPEPATLNGVVKAK